MPRSKAESSPANLASFLQRAREEFGKGDVGAARGTLTEAERIHRDLDENPEARLLFGKIARARERFKDARTHFRKAALEPRLADEARYELGRVWIEAGRLDLAVLTLREVAGNTSALIPWRVHALSGLSVAYAGLERFASAEKAIEEAAAFGLISAQLLADEATRLTALGGVDEAKLQLSRAVQIDAGCADAFFQLANLLFIQGLGARAKEALTYGIQNSPQNIRLYALMAEVHASFGEYRQAAAFYRRCLDLSPKGAHADSIRLNFARCFHLSGKAEQARIELEVLLHDHPRSGFRREARERLSALAKGTKRAKRIDNFPRSLQRRNYCGPNTLANVLNHFGADSSQDEVAEEIFTDGARWHDLVAFLKGRRGFVTRAFLGDADQLRALIDADIPVIVGEYSGLDGHCIALTGYDDHMGVVIAQDPLYYDPVEITWPHFLRSWEFTDNLVVVTLPADRADALTRLSPRDEDAVEQWLEVLAARADGKLDAARAMLSELMKWKPRYASLRRTAAEIAMMTGDWKDAGNLLRRQLKEHPTCYWALRYAGDVALRNSKLAAALDYYAHATRLFPDDSTLHYARGEIALATGRRRRGRAELVKSIEADPAALPPRLRLAREYAEQGDIIHARYHLGAVLELAPEQAEAQSLLEAIKETEAAG